MDTSSTGQKYVDTNYIVPPPIFSDPSLVDFCVDIPPVYADKLNVVYKRSSARIEGLYNFLNTKIVKAFVWDIEYGW